MKKIWQQRSNWWWSFTKSFGKPGKLSNSLRRQLRPRSKLLTHLGWRRLKPDLQRNFPLFVGITVTSLGVKPLMLLGSLWTLIWGDLRAFTTIQKFASSQVLTPLTLNKPLKYLRSQRRTKSLLLSWKFQKTLTKTLAKERRLKLLRARIRVRIRRKILLIPQRKPQILLSLSPAKLLTQGSPRRKLKLGGFNYFCIFFVVSFWRSVPHLFYYQWRHLSFVPYVMICAIRFIVKVRRPFDILTWIKYTVMSYK